MGITAISKRTTFNSDKCSDIDILGCVSNILQSIQEHKFSSVLNNGNVKSPNLLCMDATLKVTDTVDV
jgi:hypothetical protein